MLVLGRRINEQIIIGDNITVTITEIRGDKVRLGIVAPKEISVHRREVYDAIQFNKTSATAIVPSTRPSPSWPCAVEAQVEHEAKMAAQPKESAA